MNRADPIHGRARNRWRSVKRRWKWFTNVPWAHSTRSSRTSCCRTPSRTGRPRGSIRFEIPFDAAGKAWVRFAVWDSAGNGAFVQPEWMNAQGARPDR